MKKEAYGMIMSYLDIIEIELNKIALEAGHVSYEKFNMVRGGCCD